MEERMKQNKLFFILLLLATILACNTVTKPIPSAEPSRNRPHIPTFTSTAPPTITPTPKPTNTKQPKLDIPVLVEGSDNQCAGEKWAFKPVAVYRYPRSGIDLVIIDFSVHNGSDQYWGKSSLSGYSFTLFMKSGESYRPIDNLNTPFIPDAPQSPYSGTEYQRFFLPETELIHPGVTSLGLPALGGKVVPYTFGFEVGHGQKLLLVKLDSLEIMCQIPDSEDGHSTIAELNYSLEDIVVNAIPTPRPFPT
jgi:hypothetical protein